jgi:hypothetical protein
MNLRRSNCAAFSVALVVTAVAAVVAQVPKGGGPRYDTSTEVTLTGTVDSVDVVAQGSGRRALGGTHLTLKTTDATLNVHLGPTAFLEDKKLTVAKGDTLEIVGSRIVLDEETIVLARQVKRGPDAWTLRDAAGRPMWRGGKW